MFLGSEGGVFGHEGVESICDYTKQIPIKSVLLLIFDMSKTLITTNAPSLYYLLYGKEFVLSFFLLIIQNSTFKLAFKELKL